MLGILNKKDFVTELTSALLHTVDNVIETAVGTIRGMYIYHKLRCEGFRVLQVVRTGRIFDINIGVGRDNYEQPTNSLFTFNFSDYVSFDSAETTVSNPDIYFEFSIGNEVEDAAIYLDEINIYAMPLSEQWIRIAA
jgi:hypothetical protein